ncbi:hypothetical protein LWI28_001598 [Acer negundo]|uniref:Uncharacterized protein n=1 Tax=Acer negundo TaxID=4023 RepID=A0AAD5P0B9_ACENE|nr:hypothetical protein LWI28_001598 [Acer negundo]
MKRSGNPSNKDDSRKLGPYYISGTTAGSFSSIGGNAILNIFRYLSFTGGRILDNITLPTKAAYSIANGIPNPAPRRAVSAPCMLQVMNRVAYTLDMKSLPDARFPHTGQDLQPERVLATLYGCILRRVEQRCKNAGYAPEDQKRIIEAPESFIGFMREKKFEIRYNELEVDEIDDRGPF